MYGISSSHAGDISSLLSRNRVISIVERIVLKRAIEPGPVICRQRQALLQPVHQVGVTDEVSAVEKCIILSRLHDPPRILVIPSTS